MVAVAFIAFILILIILLNKEIENWNSWTLKKIAIYDICINIATISREDALIALEQVRHDIKEGFISGFATSGENDDGVVPSSFDWVSTLPAS